MTACVVCSLEFFISLEGAAFLQRVLFFASEGSNVFFRNCVFLLNFFSSFFSLEEMLVVLFLFKVFFCREVGVSLKASFCSLEGFFLSFFSFFVKKQVVGCLV